MKTKAPVQKTQALFARYSKILLHKITPFAAGSPRFPACRFTPVQVPRFVFTIKIFEKFFDCFALSYSLYNELFPRRYAQPLPQRLFPALWPLPSLHDTAGKFEKRGHRTHCGQCFLQNTTLLPNFDPSAFTSRLFGGFF